MSGYLAPSKVARAEQTIKRSRFVGLVHPIRSESEIGLAKRTAVTEFPDATHHCSAYVLGDPESAPLMHADDAGEPAGTAGRPILNVMRQRNVGDALIVVVRYFGGIQLGASGLVRAYSSTAVSALDAACVEERVETIEATIRCSYEHESLVRRITASSEAAIREVRYEDLVSFRVRLRADLAGELHDRLRDVSDGRIVMDVGS